MTVGLFKGLCLLGYLWMLATFVRFVGLVRYCHLFNLRSYLRGLCLDLRVVCAS